MKNRLKISFTILLALVITKPYAQEKRETHYKNGQVKSIYHLNEKGEMTGVYKRYYENGQLEVIGNLISSVENGKWKEYHENGQLKLKINFRDGVNSSHRHYYYENGQLEAILYIDEKGKFQGSYKAFYENGQIQRKANFVDGKPDGKSKWYYENGQLKETGNYMNGEKTGEWLYYNEDGTEKDKLKIKGKLTKNGAVGYGNTYMMGIESVLQGDLEQDTIYIVVLGEDEIYFESYLPTDSVEILFTKYEENVEYSMMPLTGFVDKNRTSWQIQQIVK